MSPRTESLLKKLVLLATVAGLGSSLVFLLVACGGSARERSAPAAPVWHTLPAAPVKIDGGFASVWTGHRLILYGRYNVTALDSRGNPYVVRSADAAESYDPASRRWTRLSPPAGPGYVPGYKAVWTGEKMLAFSAFHSVAYDPKTNAWRALGKSVGGGLVVWTGHEAIGWGGGCCGDAWGDGLAYDPATDKYRHFARSPLAPSQGPLGAWTGRELLVVVNGYSPDDKPYPAKLARAAAYDPAGDSWKRLASPPGGALRYGGTAAWDGHELLVVGNASARSHNALAFDPSADRWRRLARPPRGLTPVGAFWTGSRLLVLSGGESLRTFAYDPRADRWTSLPAVPVQGSGQGAAWAGRRLIVWSSAGGAAFVPAGS
jgi:hypothetical protein